VRGNGFSGTYEDFAISAHPRTVHEVQARGGTGPALSGEAVLGHGGSRAHDVLGTNVPGCFDQGDLAQPRGSPAGPRVHLPSPPRPSGRGAPDRAGDLGAVQVCQRALRYVILGANVADLGIDADVAGSAHTWKSSTMPQATGMAARPTPSERQLVIRPANGRCW
jgi:hypothetical protein